MLINKRFLALLLIGFLHHSLLAFVTSSSFDDMRNTSTQVGSIDDLICHGSETNLQFCCNISDLNQLYQSPTDTSSGNNTVGVINNTSNLTVDGNNFCFCLSEICIESLNGVAPCFLNCTNTLTLKNFFKIDWNKLSQTMKSNANSSQAAFISANNVSITNNSHVCFANSSSLIPSSNNNWQPGLIRACGDNNPGTLLIQNNASVIFRNNQNKAQGILCGNKIQFNNNPSLIFENNYSQGEGGAVACANSENSEVTLSNNENIVFRNNFGNKGGAFTCYNKLDFQNNGLVIFDNNRASTAGGALCLLHPTYVTSEAEANFVVRNNKELIFSRNICQSGPAIFLQATSIKNKVASLSLFADEGNITFLQNIKTEANSEPSQSCSIEILGGESYSSTPSGRLKYLCATEGHSINFYDPIIYEAQKLETAKHDLTINGVSSSNDSEDSEYGPQTMYTGTVFFSASQIPNFIKQDPEKYEKSRTSKFPCRVFQKNGTLAIDKNTTLIIRNFSQDQGILSMGANGKLQTESYIGINNLLIDLDSFDRISSGDSTPALIHTNSNGNNQISLGGKIAFKALNCFAFYDCFIIGDSFKIPILKMSAPNNTSATHNFTLETPSLKVSPSTGYSGTLKFDWGNEEEVRSSQNLPSTLYATWTPTGYNCAPYFKTPTFLNTAWMGVAAAKAISSPLLPEKNSPFKHGLAGLSVDALISSLNIRPSRGDENLHFTGNGYSLGCFLGDAFSSLEIRFGKLDGQAFNQKFNEEVNSSYYLGNICSRGSTFKTPVGEVHSALSLSYAYGRNNIYASFSEDFFGRRLSFHSRNFLAELLLSKPLTGHGLSPLLRSASPFIKASFSLSKNPGCQEVELTKDVITRQILVPVHSFVQKLMIPPPARLRQYLPSTLYNLSISPGISSESISQWNIFPVALRVSAAFSVDPYRVNPKTTMMIIQNAFPIPIRGTSLARCSAEVASSFQIKLLPGLTSYVDYKGNFSTRNISNSLKLGSSLIF
ncbi:polymorphic outer membrane protein middle domain-containing protein [Chlamydiifrater volucris]|uniref:polymorphic outer membrane protein middle domain-containing protein n=1 Tax=Chlamydiifrater volucris TaxID=2681470 RepID=UPI0032B1C86F